MLKKWEDLPPFMKCDEVKIYYNALARKRTQILIKRCLDYVMAVLLLILFSVPMLMIAVAVSIDSKGPAIFHQTRVTSYGKRFVIHKFRTMNETSQDILSLTAEQDERITRVGAFLRKTRLDELPQLYDILAGYMSFVGARPEVPEFVSQYTKEMYASLLLPAGLTSSASIRFRDEARLFNKVEGTERCRIYVEKILPEKMKDNLNDILRFSVFRDLKILIRTALCFIE